MKIGIISHDHCILHEMGDRHPESPERLRVINKELYKSEFRDSLSFFQATPATYDQIVMVHTQEYVNSILKNAPEEGYYQIDADTFMNPATLSAAYLAAGAVIQGVDLVMGNTVNQVFCSVRPPGHHAERNKGMGFCFFNNIAVGAAYALKKYGLKKIAIVDFDVHHGNGTEDIFKDNAQVLFCSSYEHPFYPFSPVVNDNPHIIHLPLPSLSTGAMFKKGVNEHFLPALTAFAPELIFISAGFDAHYSEPLAELKLSADDFCWITQELVKIAKISGQGRIVSSLEGGYNLSSLGKVAVAHIKGFLG